MARHGERSESCLRTAPTALGLRRLARPCSEREGPACVRSCAPALPGLGLTPPLWEACWALSWPRARGASLPPTACLPLRALSLSQASTAAAVVSLKASGCSAPPHASTGLARQRSGLSAGVRLTGAAPARLSGLLCPLAPPPAPSHGPLGSHPSVTCCSACPGLSTQRTKCSSLRGLLLGHFL